MAYGLFASGHDRRSVSGQENVQAGAELDSELGGGSCAITREPWNARKPERKTGIDKCIFLGGARAGIDV